MRLRCKRARLQRRNRKLKRGLTLGSTRSSAPGSLVSSGAEVPNRWHPRRAAMGLARTTVRQGDRWLCPALVMATPRRWCQRLTTQTRRNMLPQRMHLSHRLAPARRRRQSLSQGLNRIPISQAALEKLVHLVSDRRNGQRRRRGCHPLRKVPHRSVAVPGDSVLAPTWIRMDRPVGGIGS